MQHTCVPRHVRHFVKKNTHARKQHHTQTCACNQLIEACDKSCCLYLLCRACYYKLLFTHHSLLLGCSAFFYYKLVVIYMFHNYTVCKDVIYYDLNHEEAENIIIFDGDDL